MINVSGILGRPVKPGDVESECGAFVLIKHSFAISRRDAPESC
jgi:hypothetical protein